MLQCNWKLDEMLVHMGDTDHISVHWLSSIIKVEGFTGPCPCRAGGSLWSFWRVCGAFPLEANLLIVSFLSTSSACCIHSFAVLCFLVSAFPTSVEGVWQKWRPFAFSTGFGAPVATCPCTRLWFLPLLGFGGFSILNVIHLCSLLHSLQMLLCGDFQPSYLHYSV